MVPCEAQLSKPSSKQQIRYALGLKLLKIDACVFEHSQSALFIFISLLVETEVELPCVYHFAELVRQGHT